jgi:paraquat-inducible protein A
VISPPESVSSIRRVVAMRTTSRSSGRTGGLCRTGKRDSDTVVFNEPVTDPALVACPHCDLLQRLPRVLPGGSARCPRCDAELWRPRTDSLNRTFALTLAALVLYAIANTFPMLGLSAVGHQASTTVLGGARQLWVDGRVIVAGLVLFTAVVAPGLQIGLLLAIVIGARRERVPQWVAWLLRYHPTARTWSMIEVMLLGVLVALIKIAELATVVPGLALFALGALVFVFAAIQSSFDAREVWERIEWSEAASP